MAVGATAAVLERHLVMYRRLWRGSVFSSFVLPVLFLVSIGLGVGGHVGRVGGVGYLAWITPGVLASAAFQTAIGESTYAVMGDFRWVRSYHAMYAAPVRVGEMVAGRLLYVLLRVSVAAAVFLGVTALFGALRSPWAVLSLPAVALVGLAAAAPVTAFAATVEHDSYFALLFRFVVIPSALFSGVFFPVDQLPGPARVLACLSPLWHGVELSRAATLGVSPAWPVWAHVACLLVWAAAGTAWAVSAFGARLRD